MSIERVKEFFRQYNKESKIREFDVSSATVELAANALGVEPARIAKTMGFKKEDGCILIVTSGDKKIDNPKFKNKFGMKAKMLSAEEVYNLIGHKVGGVCPFCVKVGIDIYLDESLKRFKTVFPACGSSNSTIELTCEELVEYSNAKEWIDASK